MKFSKFERWFSRLRSGELLKGDNMLKTIVGKLTGRKFLTVVGTIATAIGGEAVIPDFPSWVVLVLGVTYIVVNSAQKFGLGWLEPGLLVEFGIIPVIFSG